MRYLLSVIHDRPGYATAEEARAIDEFNDRLQAGGHRVFAGGLTAPEHATVVDNRDDRGLVVHGPFLESEEFLAGFWIIDAPDLDAALELATEGSKACNRRVEVRPFE